MLLRTLQGHGRSAVASPDRAAWTPSSGALRTPTTLGVTGDVFPESVGARSTLFIRRAFGQPPQGGRGTGDRQPPALDECPAIAMDAGILSLILHYCSLCSALERVPAD
jgi:hypothetical protein